MRDNGQRKRERILPTSQPYLFRRWWNERILVLFCGLSAWCSLSFPIPCEVIYELQGWREITEVWGSWTCVNWISDCQVYEECLQILSLEKVAMSSLSTLTEWQMILEAIRTSASTVFGGVFPTFLLYPQLYHPPITLVIQMRLYRSALHHFFTQQARRKQNPWEAAGSNFHCRQWGLYSVHTEIPGKSPSS